MRPSTARALRGCPVLWLSSDCLDGRPHVVRARFVWDGERTVLFSKPNARKLRNLRCEPQAMVAKYRPLQRCSGLSLEHFTDEYSQPILLRPTRFLGYGGPGWN